MSQSFSQESPETHYTLSARPITEAEQKVALDSLKPLRYNAIGASVIGMITAVVVNFGTEIVLLGVPLLFALIAGSAVANYKKNSGLIGKALATGAVSEIAGVPVRRKFRGLWQIGPVKFPNKEGVAKMFQNGAVSRASFMPDAKIILSVNGMPLKRAVLIQGPLSGLGQGAALPTASFPPAYAPPILAHSSDGNLPPPPDDWGRVFCVKCGQRNAPDARFCGNCGTVIKK
ncbi:MAG: zinc ribbon domain-containing protein [Thermoplasmata archaeon]